MYRRDLKKQGLCKGKLGFPKCKQRSKAIGSFGLTGSIKALSDAVQVPRLGCLRWHEKDFIPTDGKILSATISEQAGRCFVSVQMEVEQEKPVPTTTPAIGVDLGIKTLATRSHGKSVANPPALKICTEATQTLRAAKVTPTQRGALAWSPDQVKLLSLK